MSKNKILPQRLVQTATKKVVVHSIVSGAYYDKNPSWRFSRLWREPAGNVYPFFGYNRFASDAPRVIPKLASYDSRLWKEISIGAKKQNHTIKLSDIIKPAREVLETINPGSDEVFSLRLSGLERIWGSVDGNGIFHIFLWDPDHQICPSLKN